MGILKNITDEYFGENVREEDIMDLTGLDVEIVSFTDCNKKIHKKGYKPKDKDNLQELLKRMIEVRGDEGDFNDIDTSDIKDMSSLFETNEYRNTKFDQLCKKFNGDITGWNVSRVKNMRAMFCGAESFNQPIGNWNVSNVTNMSGMFNYAESFNQPIGDWNVSSVENMSFMFYNAKSFNQNISMWNIISVTEMDYMFSLCPIKGNHKPKMKFSAR